MKSQLHENLLEFEANILPQLLTGQKPLSYSGLKQFIISPYRYVLHTLKKLTETDSMKLGSAEHCLLLEGVHEFENRYLCLDRSTNLAANNPDGKIGKIEYAQIEAQAANEGKTILKLETAMQAWHTYDIVMNDPNSRSLIQAATVKENRFECKIYGQNFHGYRDMFGYFGDKPFVCDIKRISQLTGKLSGDRLKWHIKENYLHLQAAIYLHENRMRACDYFFIFLDDNGAFSVRMSEELINEGRELLKSAIIDFRAALSWGIDGFTSTTYKYFDVI